MLSEIRVRQCKIAIDEVARGLTHGNHALRITLLSVDSSVSARNSLHFLPYDSQSERKSQVSCGFEKHFLVQQYGRG
jgi:hypothetical protein